MADIELFASNERLRISAKTAYNIPGELFGKKKTENGFNSQNDEYTVLYTHKSDGCPDCCKMKDQLATDRQSLKRHRQQPDRTLPRLEAINALELCVADHDKALSDHVTVEANDSNFHNDCIAGAAGTYNGVRKSW